MLQLNNKKHGIPFINCWYADKKIDEYGIIQYNEAEIVPSKKSREFHTLLSDLTESDEDILKKYSSNCRYKVRRAEREGVICSFCSRKDVDKYLLDSFCAFFLKFWEEKGVDFSRQLPKVRWELDSLQKEEAIGIGIASLDNKPIVYHTYVLAEDRARLLHSASVFREEGNKANLIGFANRYLHYQDMLALKRIGFKLYDWGGAGHSQEVENITKFKQSFGGRPMIYYSDIEYHGIFPSIYHMLANISHLIGK